MPYLKVKKMRVKKEEVQTDLEEWIFNFSVEKEIITIGRAPDNEVQLVGNNKISRYHAALIRLIDLKNTHNPTDSHFIRDLGSLHFTRVNGNIVFRKLLEEGDVIEIENFRLEYSKIQLKKDKECPIEILDAPFYSSIKGSTDEVTIFLTDYTYEEHISSLSFHRRQAMLDLLSLIKQDQTISSLLEKSIEIILNIANGKTGFIALITEDKEISEYASGRKEDKFKIYKNMLDKIMQGKPFQDSSNTAIPISGVKKVLGFIYLNAELGEKDAGLLHVIANSIGNRIEEINSHKNMGGDKGQDDSIVEWPVTMITHSKKMSKICSEIKAIASADIDVLILGETGSGKQMVAEEIHKLSTRAAKPFVTVDCAQLHDPLHTQSDLFGHKKGSFTGASTERKGAFQLADKGTIFLDEIGEISLNIQGELLRVLANRTIKPLGSDRPINVDVRIVAATNRNLQDDIDGSRFREDLYYRLTNGIVISLPPLRERVEDIPLLAHFFVDKYTKKHSRHIKGISHGTMRVMMEYPWPGNIRQLEGCIESAILKVSEQKELLFLWDFPPEIQEAELEGKGGEGKLRKLREVEREEIERVLAFTAGNITRAAKALGITRPTLYKKIKEYGILV